MNVFKNKARDLGLVPTLRSARFDVLRLRARWRVRQRTSTALKKVGPNVRIHLGCGNRKVPGWLNVDVSGSDLNVDLSSGKLPFTDESISKIATQHVVEHLYYDEQFIPLMKEMNRVLVPGGIIWLSCPDLSKAINSYLMDKCKTLVEDRLTRFPNSPIPKPSQHFLNVLFHQNGSHKNLFDFEMLEHAANFAGMSEIVEIDEEAFLLENPEFPRRADELQTIYVKIVK